MNKETDRELWLANRLYEMNREADDFLVTEIFEPGERDEPKEFDHTEVNCLVDPSLA